MKPLYISATKQDTGKTTFMLGFVRALRDMGRDVGCMKPVGQRYVQYQGLNVDEDIVLARHVFDLQDHPGDMSSIAIEPGFTARYIFHRDPAPLEGRLLTAFMHLKAAHELLVIEGTGHAGVGSCFDLSNARVAELFGAGVVIVTEGGIGRAIDEAALSLHLFRKHRVPVLGVVLNKVWPAKMQKVRDAVARGLEHLGTRLLGAVPLCDTLLRHRVDQAAEVAAGRVLACPDAVSNVVHRTVVAAMRPEHVARYIEPHTLVVAAGDRLDPALVATFVGPAGAAPPVAGVVLTGGFEPPADALDALRRAGVPVILCDDDTYTVASRLKTMRFKIRVEDADKIQAAQDLVHEHIDVAAILDALRE